MHIMISNIETMETVAEYSGDGSEVLALRWLGVDPATAGGEDLYHTMRDRLTRGETMVVGPYEVERVLHCALCDTSPYADGRPWWVCPLCEAGLPEAEEARRQAHARPPHKARRECDGWADVAAEVLRGRKCQK